MTNGTLVSRRIRWALVPVVTLILAGHGRAAEPTVTELEKQPFGVLIRELMELGNGDAVLWTSAHVENRRRAQDPNNLLERWYGAYLFDSDGRLKQRLQLPPTSVYQRIVPYRNGLACQCLPGERAQQARVLAWDLAAGREPTVVYDGGNAYHSMELVAGPGGRDLYVSEVGMQGYRLTRIDEQGRIAWQKQLQQVESGSLIATNDGIALVRWVQEPNLHQVLTSIDRDGRTRWETPLANRLSGRIWHASAGFIAIAHGTPTGARVTLYDALTGEAGADATIPNYSLATGTKRGLLLAGRMSGQAFVAMLGRDGKLAWLRRYAVDDRINDIQQALLTRDDRLLLVSHERTPSTVQPVTSLVATDGAAASLQNLRGRCLDPNWSRSLELEALLEKKGVYFDRPKDAPPPSAAAPCATQKDADGLAFMEALAAALPANMTIGKRQITAVSLQPAGQAPRLEQYSADWSGYPSAGVSLSFAVSADRAREFAAALAGSIQAHLDRMTALQMEFNGMTGFYYVVLNGPSGDFAHTFSDLEAAARAVNKAIATIPDAKLARIRDTGPSGWVQILLQTDGFGAGTGALYPAAAADRTFLEIVERNRRDAEQGNIDIRD